MTKRLRQNERKENPSTLRRVGRYGPLLLWIAFISFASTGEFSSDNSSRFVRPLLLWLFPGISEGQLAGVHFLTRKLSHLAEYAVLAFLARRAFVLSSNEFIQRRWFQLSLTLVVLCSLLDEFQQSYSPTRSASLLDCGIDVIGGLTVLLIFRAYGRRSGRRMRAA
ncbi:MAG: VanZ family protein [Pyrinomonadaceae bacterium]|nr:VanZ family protein [Pyrinomonadaceae bacterium]